MALPGFAFFLAVGVAVIGALYFTLRDQNEPYNYNYNGVYVPPRRIEPKTPRRRRSVKSADTVTTSEDNNCTICLEPFNEGPTRTLDCAHSFHCACINQWFARCKPPSCPNCRTSC